MFSIKLVFKVALSMANYNSAKLTVTLLQIYKWKKYINASNFEHNTKLILLTTTAFTLKPGYQKTDKFENQNFTDNIANWRQTWSDYIAAKNVRNTTRHFSYSIFLQDIALSTKNSF